MNLLRLNKLILPPHIFPFRLYNIVIASLSFTLFPLLYYLLLLFTISIVSHTVFYSLNFNFKTRFSTVYPSHHEISFKFLLLTSRLSRNFYHNTQRHPLAPNYHHQYQFYICSSDYPLY